MRGLRNLRIRSKLLLMLTIPILGLLFFSISSVAQKSSLSSKMDDLYEITRLSVKMSALVHELQKERGATGVFLANEGKSFSSELQKQYRETDNRYAELKNFLSENTISFFTHELSRLTIKLNGIKDYRLQVQDLSISGDESTAFYTQINSNILTIINEVARVGSSSRVTRLATAYINFLQGKERAGLERALLSRVFSKDYFFDDSYQKFISLVSLQDTYFNVFKSIADVDQRNFFNLKMDNPSVQEVINFRKQAMDKADTGNFNVAPGEWFSSITGKINLLKEIEDKLSFDLQRTAAAVREASDSSLYLSVILAVVSLGMALLLGLLISREITRSLKEVTVAAEDLALGRIDIELNCDSNDELGELSRSFVRIVDSQKTKIHIAREIAAGNLEVDVKPASKDDELSHSMETMIFSLKHLQEMLHETILSQKNGQLNARCTVDKLKGSYAELLKGINEALDSVIQPVLQGIEIIREYAEGNLEKSMRPLPGEQRKLSEAVSNIQKNIKSLIDEGLHISREAAMGNLGIRGNANKFNGDYKKIISGFNSTLDAVIDPIHNLLDVFGSVADGDLTRQMEGDYKGDFKVLQDSFNRTISALDQTLSQVSSAVEQVTNGSDQVSASSQSLSQGATEQASSLQETSASMTEISSQSSQNAQNAYKAKNLSARVEKTAESGNKKMQEMLSSMQDINKSSTHISKIIKVIDEIAFQTNLLALNAAVEAARAGVHGKGFAVVAEEVRNLAQRSAKAAKETTELIEGSVQSVNKGNEIANTTYDSLEEIIKGIKEVNVLIEEISNASDEQVKGTEQISEALNQIDQVTQTNTATAEECASIAEELSGQASNLKQMINKFKLSDVSVDSREVELETLLEDI